MADIEEQFDEAVQKANKKIDQLLKKAEEALAEAEKISEEYGVPFYANVSPIYQQYTPESFFTKWEKIDPEYAGVEDADEYGGSGWQHSDVC